MTPKSNHACSPHTLGGITWYMPKGHQRGLRKVVAAWSQSGGSGLTEPSQVLE